MKKDLAKENPGDLARRLYQVGTLKLMPISQPANCEESTMDHQRPVSLRAGRLYKRCNIISTSILFVLVLVLLLLLLGFLYHCCLLFLGFPLPTCVHLHFLPFRGLYENPLRLLTASEVDCPFVPWCRFVYCCVTGPFDAMSNKDRRVESGTVFGRIFWRTFVDFVTVRNPIFSGRH